MNFAMLSFFVITELYVLIKKTLAFVLNILFCRFYPAEPICLMSRPKEPIL